MQGCCVITASGAWTALPAAAWQPPPPRPARRQRRAPQPSAAAPSLAERLAELSGSGVDASLPADAGAALSLPPSPLLAASQHPQLLAAELLLAAAGAYAAAAWPTRPRGWSAKGLLRVAPSQVAGIGVFAAAHIEAGTVLGAYPGRPRCPADMAAKAASAPAARDYCFRTRSGMLLDPTDAGGRLSAAPAPGLPWLPADFTLAYINEPPRGAGGCSVTVEDDPGDPNGLLCVAARDIAAGEELFMDYGLTYDRSKYQGGSSGAEGGGSGEQ